MNFKPTLVNKSELDKQKQIWIESVDKDNPVNIFAYGSLMWNPSCNVNKKTNGVLIGYHRDFCLYSYMYRGTLKNLGLVLGIRKGGNCDGLIVELGADNILQDLSCLWDREMITGAYKPVLKNVETASGIKKCWVFVANTNHNQWAGDLSLSQQAQLIATAQGDYGTNLEYLFNTVKQLQLMNIYDNRLEDLANITKQLISD